MVNTSYNRHKFRQDRQQEGESVGQYTTRLRGLAKLCNFPAAQVPEFIKDQVIDHCRSQKLRTKLLATRDLTLARTLDIAQAMEASERQASEINAERREPDRVYATGHAGGRCWTTTTTKRSRPRNRQSSDSVYPMWDERAHWAGMQMF